MRQRSVVLAMVLLLLIPGPPTLLASAETNTSLVERIERVRQLAMIRRASARYHRLEVAEADGFVPLFGCIDSPGQGAMGWHYVNPERMDGNLVLEEPDGRARLLGVEYVVPAAAWEESDPPEFLGQTLLYKTTVGSHGPEDGVDPYYEVHAWVWYRNPTGVFADWNPAVICPPD
jgi:hypothetical protein